MNMNSEVSQERTDYQQQQMNNMATADTAFFVLKFECFSNAVLIKEYELSSTLGNAVASLYEEENVTVTSVFFGTEENNISYIAELDTPFSVFTQFGHKYFKSALKETNRPKANSNQQLSDNIFNSLPTG